MTTKQVSELLQSEYVSKYKGQFKYWRGYFYRFNMTPEKLVTHVKEKIPTAIIVDSGDHWATFNGGAKSGSSKDSYMWVKFVLPSVVEKV